MIELLSTLISRPGITEAVKYEIENLVKTLCFYLLLTKEQEG